MPFKLALYRDRPLPANYPGKIPYDKDLPFDFLFVDPEDGLELTQNQAVAHIVEHNGYPVHAAYTVTQELIMRFTSPEVAPLRRDHA